MSLLYIYDVISLTDVFLVGVFLIPYIVSMLLCGYPLMFIELALGQYGRQGIVSIWKVCPLFEGKSHLPDNTWANKWQVK